MRKLSSLVLKKLFVNPDFVCYLFKLVLKKLRKQTFELNNRMASSTGFPTNCLGLMILYKVLKMQHITCLKVKAGKFLIDINRLLLSACKQNRQINE